jgi:hypothetical protein
VFGSKKTISLGSGVPAQSQLTSVVWQDGAIRRYHHEAQNGTITFIAYDSKGHETERAVRRTPQQTPTTLRAASPLTPARWPT